MNEKPDMVRMSMRDFWALGPYHNELFSYSYTSVNIAKSKTSAIMRTTGRLCLHPMATPQNCLGGNLLIETGKKLSPFRNPGVKRNMVSVIDITNHIHGYIDPESPRFVTLSKPREIRPKPKPVYNDWKYVNEMFNKLCDN
jgi:hypothetical protein